MTISMTVERTAPVIDKLDHVQAIITLVAPTALLRSVFAILAAMAVLWLMQTNTSHAGVTSRIQIVRLIQRIAMVGLVLALVLMASSPLLNTPDYHDLLMLLVVVPLFIMTVCSILVGKLRHHAIEDAQAARQSVTLR